MIVLDYFIYYGLTIVALLISGGASLFIKITYNSNSKINNSKGILGKDAARKILDKNGLSNVNVESTSGYLSDHYDPTTKKVNLSSTNFGEASIAAVAVAAHECGHAIQDKVGFLLMRIRHALVPVVNLCSYAGYIAIAVGCLFSLLNLVWIGIIAEGAILLFQLVTLPVEIDASRRALKEIKSMGILESREYRRGKRVLIAAALTYVAGVLSALIQILRLLLMFTRRRN